jgi:hypothetical protein
MPPRARRAAAQGYINHLPVPLNASALLQEARTSHAAVAYTPLAASRMVRPVARVTDHATGPVTASQPWLAASP